MSESVKSSSSQHTPFERSYTDTDDKRDLASVDGHHDHHRDLDSVPAVPHDHTGPTQVVVEEDEDQLDGVTKIEALYLVFGKGWKLWLLYVSIGLISWVYSLSQNTTYVYQAFATSAFEKHAIIGTIGIVNSIMSGVGKPFIAKIADITSRPAALSASIALYCLGGIVLAASSTVSAVCVGLVIFTMGSTGIDLLTSIIVGDITSLQWRGFMNALCSAPFIMNAFVAGYISSDIKLTNWRWGYGMFVILVPVSLAPAIFILFWASHKSKKIGALSLASSSYARRQALHNAERQPWIQMCIEYLNKMDIIGMIILATTWSMLLLPFSLEAGAKGHWGNPSLIAMFVVGGVLMAVFLVWEFKFAPHPLQPMRVLNRSFMASVCIDFMYYLSGYVADTYFTSWVYVVKDWDTRDYTFYTNTETVGLCVFGVVAGIVLRVTHRYKYLQFAGLCIRCIGMGISFYAATKDTAPTDATLVMCRIVVSIGGAISVVSSQVASQASVPHADMAIAISLLALYTSIGGSIGSAISAAIWSNRLPKNLEKYMSPYLNATQIEEIYGSIVVARLAEPREEIIKAYNHTAYSLFLPALILSFLPLAAGLMTTNFYLGDRHNAVESKKVVLQSEPGPDVREGVILERARKAEAEAAASVGGPRTTV